MPPTFRLGSTSYIIAGDLLTNVQRAAGIVQDVELVLFDLDSGESNLPTPAEVEQLANVAATHTMTYTVHLPLDIQYAENHPSLALAEKVMRLTAPLHPYAYLFHLDGTQIDQPDWIANGKRAIEQLLQWAATPQQLALENLESYSPEALLPHYAEFPIGRALDIGHVWKMGRNPLLLFEDWLPHTRVIHLHGVSFQTQQDHLALNVLPPLLLKQILRRVWDWNGVLTLEVFEDDFFSSYDTFVNLYQEQEKTL